MKTKFFYGWIIVICSFFIIALLWGSFYTFGVFFKPVVEEFGWSGVATSGAYSLSFVCMGVFGLVSGRLTDRFGPRLAVTICGLSFGIGFSLMSQISTIWQLYVFYGMIGIGMSAMLPLNATVMRWFVKRRGMIVGINVSGIGFGTIIMPPLTRLLISNYGWSTSYMIVGIIALIIITLMAQFLHRDPQQKGQLAYGEGELEVQEVQRASISLKQATRVRQFWFLILVLFIHLFMVQSIMAHLAPHVIESGISAVAAANALAIIGGSSIVGRITMGSISDRIGVKLAMLIAYCFFVLPSLIWLAAVAKQEWMFYLFAALFGFGYGGETALVSLLTAELFGLAAVGTLMGATGMGATMGGALGPIVAGYIFDVTGTYSLAFWIDAFMVMIAIPLIASLKKVV